MKQQAIRIKEEVGRCLLCHEPRCNEVYLHDIDVDRSINRKPMSFEEASRHTRENLADTMESILRLLKAAHG